MDDQYKEQTLILQESQAQISNFKSTSISSIDSNYINKSILQNVLCSFMRTNMKIQAIKPVLSIAGFSDSRINELIVNHPTNKPLSKVSQMFVDYLLKESNTP